MVLRPEVQDLVTKSVSNNTHTKQLTALMGEHRVSVQDNSKVFRNRCLDKYL